MNWDLMEICPTVQLKYGVKRSRFELRAQPPRRRGHIHFLDRRIDLKGRWDNSPGFGSLLSLTLTNTSDESLRLTRLTFPTENGIDGFMSDYRPEDLSFLRNGYQSWSTARSYRLTDKPIRPWLQMVSLASSNMANLPSNTPGALASDMYSVISNLATGESFLVGQAEPFDQFFYIRLNRYKEQSRVSHFELVYDFGRKLLPPEESLHLDGILMAKGDTATLQSQYFDYVNRRMKVKIPKRNLTGWSSWYFYYNKITPKNITDNVEEIKKRGLDIDFVQIDDGYQKRVGDWLVLNEPFQSRMPLLADTIRKAGYRPGIWIAPFIAEKNSELTTNHPEYVLKNEYGRPIKAGYNIFWPGHTYYGLDITNYRFEEYLRRVIRTIVHEWGFELLKCDFLFGGCLRGGTHNDLEVSRAEVLKRGMSILREEAGKNVFVIGCGMPLSAGIGLVDSMRVGPDTGPYWTKMAGKFLHTAAMVGVRNSLRNLMVRSAMHKRLWLNDPECLMIRTENTHLTEHERMSQINAIILTGGPLLYSDDMAQLGDERFQEMKIIGALNQECFAGEPITLDVMEAELPSYYYNTAGYLGVFNGTGRSADRTITLDHIQGGRGKAVHALENVWSGERVPVSQTQEVLLADMPPHSSRLFRLIR